MNQKPKARGDKLLIFDGIHILQKGNGTSHFPVLFLILSLFILVAGNSFPQQVNSNSGKVTGTVTDAVTGEPLPGVNIQIEGTLQGMITDASGKYNLSFSDQNAVLIFSFVGYITEKISINGSSVVDVKLSPDVTQLEEVVVVGYGTQKKGGVT